MKWKGRGKSRFQRKGTRENVVYSNSTKDGKITRELKQSFDFSISYFLLLAKTLKKYLIQSNVFDTILNKSFIFRTNIFPRV